MFTVQAAELGRVRAGTELFRLIRHLRTVLMLLFRLLLLWYIHVFQVIVPRFDSAHQRSSTFFA